MSVLSPADCELLFLGTGSSMGVPRIGCDCPVCRSDDPKLHRTRSSVVITSPAGRLLIDTGPDLRMQVLRERIQRIDSVLFTHSHADHLFGLDDLRTFCRQLNGPMPIYCEASVESMIRQCFAYAFAPEAAAYPAGSLPSFAFRRIDRPTCAILDHAIIPIPLWHGKQEILGFRFGSLAYCTDVSAIPDSSWPLLQDLEVLIISALWFKPHPTHFSFDEALAAIERIRPKRALLTHLSCRLDPVEAQRRMPAQVQLAHDGLRVPFK